MGGGHDIGARIPAEIGGEDVEQLVPADERVEDGAVRAVDHVALVGRPKCHLPSLPRESQSCKS